MSEQITFATSDFASNPEPRCPCILLLDVSGSMNGRPINELNAGLVTFRDELCRLAAGNASRWTRRKSYRFYDAKSFW